ncbi:MAG: hypothetical protein WC777_06260 [Candidatus Gracilibacteria bacterium]|jgi:hypothetical protein
MKNQLNTLAAALSVGLLWGVGLLLWTLIALQWGMGVSSLELVMEWYPAYEITATGAFIGLLWGFLDGFLGTYILVSLYNFIAKKLSK